MSIHYPTITIPRPDGSFILRPGAPMVLEELTTAQFARVTGMAQRTVQALCDEGKLKYRRLTIRPGSKLLIPSTELERFKTQPA